MCAEGARPGSYGPHVGGSPAEGGHSTLSAPSGLIGSLLILQGTAQRPYNRHKGFAL